MNDTVVLFEAPQICWDSRTLLKCMYGCSDWGKNHTCPSRPNNPSMAELKEMFSRYKWGIIIHTKEKNLSQKISMAVESAAFHDGYYFAMSLSDCGLSTIAELSNALMLLELDLSNNAIGDITPLSGMTALEKLDLSENAVSDLSALAGVVMLKQVDVSHNALSSIAPLTSCAGMTELDVSYNSITEIGAVKNMLLLKAFRADHNSISAISALSGAVSASTT